MYGIPAYGLWVQLAPRPGQPASLMNWYDGCTDGCPDEYDGCPGGFPGATGSTGNRLKPEPCPDLPVVYPRAMGMRDVSFPGQPERRPAIPYRKAGYSLHEGEPY